MIIIKFICFIQEYAKTILNGISYIGLFINANNFISGEQGIDAFNLEAERQNVCIALQQKVPSNANHKKFIEV